MSIWQRVRTLFAAKAHGALDRVEHPAETLELAYQKQLRMSQELRRSIADVLTSEKRLEIEANQLASLGERHHAEAEIAARRGDDTAARRALEAEAFTTMQRGKLLGDVAAVRAQRASLETMAEEIARRVDLFRTQKLALTAKYAAAKAAARAGETVTGVSEEMSEVAAMVERAREQALQIQARAEALTQLATQSPSLSATIDRAWVDAQLAALSTARPALGDAPER